MNGQEQRWLDELSKDGGGSWIDVDVRAIRLMLHKTLTFLEASSTKAYNAIEKNQRRLATGASQG